MTTSPPTPLTDAQLHTLAEDLLDALLDSADTTRVGPARWWERAKTALETAAASSTTFREAAARAGRKMEVTAFRESSSSTIADLAQILDDPTTFGRWRTLATRDALVITAMVRARRRRRTTRTPEQGACA